MSTSIMLDAFAGRWPARRRRLRRKSRRFDPVVVRIDAVHVRCFPILSGLVPRPLRRGRLASRNSPRRARDLFCADGRRATKDCGSRTPPSPWCVRARPRFGADRAQQYPPFFSWLFPIVLSASRHFSVSASFPAHSLVRPIGDRHRRPKRDGRPRLLCSGCTVAVVADALHARLEPTSLTRSACLVCRGLMSRRRGALTCSHRCRHLLSRAHRYVVASPPQAVWINPPAITTTGETAQ